MGQKHNRRRTRSRPRNRNHGSNNHSRLSSVSSRVSDSSVPPIPQPSFGPALTSVGRLPAHHWDMQYAAWQERRALEAEKEEAPETWDAAKAVAEVEEMKKMRQDDEDERLLRMFGGEKGDETSLCGPMLQVVMDLFDGVDYVDP